MKTISATRYVIILFGLLVYVIGLIVYALTNGVSMIWLFYGALPGAAGLYLAVHSFHANHQIAKHTEVHLRSINVSTQNMARDIDFIRRRLS